MLGLDGDQIARLLFLVLLLAFVARGLFGRGQRVSSFRHLAIWALIAIGLVAIYAYRAPLQRLAAPVLHELDPSRVIEVTDPDGAPELAVARAGDGHFYLDAEVNGAPVSFLVETGATATVLTLADAERAGIEIGSLEFNRAVQTANGIAYFAPTNVQSLEIGPFRLNNVPVGVMAEDALGTSLLGMNTIDRVSGWRVDGNRMVLTP